METANASITKVTYAWSTRLGISLGFAGFLALMALVSFKLPWTPVPFSLMPLGLLIVGVAQRPAWSLLSVAIYLVVGGMGAPIFAEGASGWSHFIGNTGGYLIGFMLVSPIVSWYGQASPRLMPRNLVRVVLAALAAVAIGGTAAIIKLTGTGTGFADYGEDAALASWGVSTSVLWIMLYLGVAAAAAVAWFIKRESNPSRALDLFVVMIGATAVLHVCGVTVLWLATPLSLMTAIILGSVVFLPFDIIKAGLAVAVSLPFLPSESKHA